MINVTNNAVRQLQSLLPALGENAQKGLRVQVAKGGCSGLHYEMTLDEKKEGDAVVERDGMHFFIDGESVPYLRGATLVFSGGLNGTGFQVLNPNASRTCGCGSSFETTQSPSNQGIFSRSPDGLWCLSIRPAARSSATTHQSVCLDGCHFASEW